MSNVVAAVDCGATSVRVCRVDLDAEILVPEVVHRVAHEPRRDDTGSLRWDWRRIVGAVVAGLERCLELGPLTSIGIDTWAVDYGLLDETGALIADPYSYRDGRTAGFRTLVERVGEAEMFAMNGLQLQPFNTVFQLAVHDPDELRRARRLLWLPELLVHELTGVEATERSCAVSSGLVDVTTNDWSTELLDLAGVDRSLVGTVVSAGRLVGEWRGVPVALVAGHDTASAVAGMGLPAPGGSMFLATGTWMLAGVERTTPDVSAWARARNFSNEAGALGGYRFLRNVTGFWLLERCRVEWGSIDRSDLIAGADAVDVPVAIVDVDADELRAPADMLTAYTALAGLARTTNPAVVTRSIVESIAVRVAEVAAQLREVGRFDDIVVFGGGARVPLLWKRLQAVARVPLRVGSPEAAALGNALVQGVALGEYRSLADGQQRLSAPASPGVDGGNRLD